MTSSSSSDTASFTDPIFLATYGLNRITVLDYFLHPLNPFRTKSKCCNDILISQQISIGFIMQNGIGMRPGPLSLSQAEEEFSNALKRLQGEQYELIPVHHQQEESHVGSGGIGVGSGGNATTPKTTTTTTNDEIDIINSPLFTIRHVHRTSETKVTPLGIYYVLEGVIYKAPSARSLMKASVARTTQGLIDACNTLRQYQKYNPRTGYYWDFFEASQEKRSTTTVMADKVVAPAALNDVHDHDTNDNNDDKDNNDINDDYDEQSIAEILHEYKMRVNQMDMDYRMLSSSSNSSSSRANTGSGTKRSQEEEQGIRAREKINSILLGLPKLQLPL
mmetsp:Transcript_15807/g.29827  ORF Transcript_15807/g.29827 Transcript_15807/m.29827 type:complete len:334 (+) Transcript_15807:52-1053(+)